MRSPEARAFQQTIFPVRVIRPLGSRPLESGGLTLDLRYSKPMSTRPDWISAQEAADLLHISRPRIHQLVKANVLDGAHVGGRLLVHRRSVEIRRRTNGMRRAEIVSRPTLESLRERRNAILPLIELHGARNLRLFGSAARGDSRLDSDIDFLVDLEPGRGARDMTELAIDLEEALGRQVDLVIDDGSPAAAAIAAAAVPI